MAAEGVRIGEQQFTAVQVFGFEIVIVNSYIISLEISSMLNPTEMGLFRVTS